MSALVVGVDVGGTNTDAVVLDNGKPLGWAKLTTPRDVNIGVARAVRGALRHALQRRRSDTGCEELLVRQVNIGTTHFVNAVVQRQGLAKVAIIRLCGPASRALPPFSDFPVELQEVIDGGTYCVDGGYEHDGKTVISPVKEEEINSCAKDLQERKIKNVVICGIFSTVNSDQEIQVDNVLRSAYPGVSTTLSYTVGHTGLLARENAAILNESLKPLCRQTIGAMQQTLADIGLTCPFFLTQNDGTIISAAQALELPVHTFASGPTNSMRGAALLSGVKEAVVVDIGGTSTDVGILQKGFPREASVHVKVGGVTTNFRMPDVVSVGLGGGSIITEGSSDSRNKVSVGPQSVGARLCEESRIFAGADHTLTATDVAVAAGQVTLGDPENVSSLEPSLVAGALEEIHKKVERAIDQVKLSAEDVPVVLVGGGSILIREGWAPQGTERIIRPKHYEIANAVGAAVAQVSATVSTLVSLTAENREEMLTQIQNQAKTAAVQADAAPESLQVVELAETPLSYLPGNVSSVKVKVIGDLSLQTSGEGIIYKDIEEISTKIFDEENSVENYQQMPPAIDELQGLEETEPYINPDTGEWELTTWDVECIAVGAGILGCGGGGNPSIGRLISLKVLAEGKKIRVIHPERFVRTVEKGDTFMVAAFMGAPSILHESLLAGTEFTDAMMALHQLYNINGYSDGILTKPGDIKVEENNGVTYIRDYKPVPLPVKMRTTVKALMSAEIGGLNSMIPLVVGAQLDLPLLDCDGMGRAFPELQMFIPFIFGAKAYPSITTSKTGWRSVALKVDKAKELENHFRNICIEMGCSSGLLFSNLPPEDIRSKTVQYSFSRAFLLGRAVLHARKSKTNPVQAILQAEPGSLLCEGKVHDLQRAVKAGFNKGKFKVEGQEEFTGMSLEVDFQNENLIATKTTADRESKVVACTPDLICVVDLDTGEPIPTEEMAYGLRVAVLTISSPELLRTPEALAVIGPQAFGYPQEKVKYSPCGPSCQVQPIPPS